MKAEICMITPKMAAKLLERNPYNRNLSARTVEIYAEAMRRNEWHSNGESISIDEDGNLINGQHRLAACVKAGVPFCTTLVTGVKKQDSYLFDKGRGRTVRNTIAIAQAHGEMDNDKMYTSNAMLSVARYILAIGETRKRTGKQDAFVNKAYEAGITPERIYQYMRSRKDSFEWLMGHVNRMKKRIRTTGVATALFQAYESGYPAEKLDDLCECLITGMMKSSADKLVIKLREKIINAAGGDTPATRRDFYLMTQNALKAYEDGRYNARIAAKTEYYKGAYEE